MAALRHEFVEFIPDELASNTIYISTSFATVAHRCCCGCGKEVVTPLSPLDWQLTFDGETISLFPSIGNWSFPCQSHYWIDHSVVRWAEQWSEKRIAAGRARDVALKRCKYGATEKKSKERDDADRAPEIRHEGAVVQSLFRRLTKRLFG